MTHGQNGITATSLQNEITYLCGMLAVNADGQGLSSFLMSSRGLSTAELTSLVGSPLHHKC